MYVKSVYLNLSGRRVPKFIKHFRGGGGQTVKLWEPLVYMHACLYVCVYVFMHVDLSVCGKFALAGVFVRVAELKTIGNRCF